MPSKIIRKSVQTPLGGVPGHLGPLLAALEPPLAALTAPLASFLPLYGALGGSWPLLHDFGSICGSNLGVPGGCANRVFDHFCGYGTHLAPRPPQSAPRTSKTYHFGQFFVLSGPPKSQFLMIWEASRLTQNRYFFIILNKVFELVLGLSLWAAQGNLGTALGTVAGWPKATGYR